MLAIAVVGSIETAPAENAHMPNAAEVIAKFAEYIVFSNAWGASNMPFEDLPSS
jgi:hypothetical protein